MKPYISSSDLRRLLPTGFNRSYIWLLIVFKLFTLAFYFAIPYLVFHKDRIYLYQLAYWVTWVSAIVLWILWQFKNRTSVLILAYATALVVFLAEYLVILLDSSDLSIGGRRINKWMLYAFAWVLPLSWGLYIVSRRLTFSLLMTWGLVFYFSGVFGLTLRIWSYALDFDGIIPMVYSGTVTAFAIYPWFLTILVLALIYSVLFGPAAWSFYKSQPVLLRYRFHLPLWITYVFLLVNIPVFAIHQEIANDNGAEDIHQEVAWATPDHRDQKSKGTIVDMLDKKNQQMPDGYNEGIDKLRSLVPTPVLPTQIPEESQDITVIFYLLESFAYPPYAESWSYSRNPTPHLSELAEKFPSGSITSVSGGGGTPLSQFEIITGLHSSYAQRIFLHFAQFRNRLSTFVDAYKMQDIPTFFLKTNRGIFSIDEAIKKLGFKAIFRPTVDFPVLPEDRLPSDKNWLFDNSTFSRHLMTSIEPSNSRHLTFVQGIGAHGPWMDRMRPKDTSLTLTTTEGLSADDVERLDLYAKALERVDNDIRRLTEFYSKKNKRTLILFYTDHSPGYFPRHIAQILNNTSGELDTVKAIFSSGMYLLWANYPIEDYLEGRTYSHNRLSMAIQKHYLGFQPYYVQVLDALLKDYSVASLFLAENSRKELRAKSEWTDDERTMMSLYDIARYDLLDGPQQLLNYPQPTFSTSE